ncbi:hypothetical protein J6590_029753 [Homalodisca vitripennis]|nr:hypothetical protein J6590_029753 [Homalodisca vitripennis]
MRFDNAVTNCALVTSTILAVTMVTGQGMCPVGHQHCRYPSGIGPWPRPCLEELDASLCKVQRWTTTIAQCERVHVVTWATGAHKLKTPPKHKLKSN